MIFRKREDRVHWSPKLMVEAKLLVHHLENGHHLENWPSEFFTFVTVGLPGLAGSPDLGFRFPWSGGIPYPHQVIWSQPMNMRLAKKREPIRGKLKSPRTPKFEKSPRRFGPIRLLCKHVTNPLKPATNCLCTRYKLGNSLGSAVSDPLPLRWTRGGSPDSSQQLNFPFFASCIVLEAFFLPAGGFGHRA